jgi:aminocarboxymuconate-semialdehyde decarboxylase
MGVMFAILGIDSLTHSPRVLKFALETFGSERIVLGSDYPFKPGVDDPVDELEPLGLDAATRCRLTTDNARELLALRSVRQLGEA